MCAHVARFRLAMDRKDTETAIKDFYTPYLNALMYGVKPQATATANSDTELPAQGVPNAS